MRTHTIDNTTIEYPDQIGFCFNPVIINILGGNYQYVTATVKKKTPPPPQPHQTERTERRSVVPASLTYHSIRRAILTNTEKSITSQLTPKIVS